MTLKLDDVVHQFNKAVEELKAWASSIPKPEELPTVKLSNESPPTPDRNKGCISRCECLAVSLCGGLVAVGCQNGNIFLRYPNNDSKFLSGHFGRVLRLAFSGDGSMLASGSDTGDVRVWDIDSDDTNPVYFIKGTGKPIVDMAINSGGNTLVFKDDSGVAHFWDIS